MKVTNFFMVLTLTAGITLGLFTAPGHAQTAKLEIHPLASTTLTDQEFLTGKKEGKPVIIAGELRIPKSSNDRLPAVILVHGSGGVGLIEEWVVFLNAMGIATFLPDSFTGRGIKDQSQLSRLAVIIDAYRSLELLGNHPRIDPQRIAVMGFSRGGVASLYASMKRFQRLHGPAKGPEFAAYIAFYPNCHTTFLQDDDVADKPVRIFHGSADDWVSVAPVRSYVERLRKAGRDVQLTEYADAYHQFDRAMYKTPEKLAQAPTPRNCQFEEVAVGQIINSRTKQPFSQSDPCMERGVTVAYNAKAAGEAQKAVKEFLQRVLKP